MLCLNGQSGASSAGLRSLMRWAKRFEKRRWAVEGASGTGHLLAQRHVASGERAVVDVPAELSARIKVLSVGNEYKNYRLDAFYVAMVGWRTTTGGGWMRRNRLLC